MAHHGREGTEDRDDDLPRAKLTQLAELKSVIIETLAIAAGGGPNPFGGAIKTLRQRAVALKLVEDPKKRVEDLERTVRDYEQSANIARSDLQSARRALEQFESASPGADR